MTISALVSSHTDILIVSHVDRIPTRPHQWVCFKLTGHCGRMTHICGFCVSSMEDGRRKCASLVHITFPHTIHCSHDPQRSIYCAVKLSDVYSSVGYHDLYVNHVSVSRKAHYSPSQISYFSESAALYQFSMSLTREVSPTDKISHGRCDCSRIII
jgi:hypothetical protein